jgi:hypothetical protein
MCKASETEDIDAGKIIKYSDVLKPRYTVFNTGFFMKWAQLLLNLN